MTAFISDSPTDGRVNPVLIDITVVVDEEGPQLSITIRDPTRVHPSDGLPVEMICFSVNDPDGIASFFRDVEAARPAMPPNLVDR